MTKAVTTVRSWRGRKLANSSEIVQYNTEEKKSVDILIKKIS